MKIITIRGKHYIWRPAVLGHNILKGIAIMAFLGFFSWAMLVFMTGGPLW
jgi:hypothetical protein